MNAQAGERYRCSDSNCGCEIEITTPGAVQDDSEDDVIGSPNDRSIVGWLFTTDADSRHPRAAAMSTAGDYGALGSNSTSMGSFRSNSSNTSDMESGSTGEVTFSCCCGQPMRKSSSRGQSSTRVMG